MKSKTPESYRSKSVKTTKTSGKKYREEQTIERRLLPATPPEAHKNYLTDEIWDILPKTDYTYARSGSYSPRFFGKKYKSPNMSRYRIRVKGRGQEAEEAEFSDEGEEEFADEQNHLYDDFDDRSSNVSYETEKSGEQDYKHFEESFVNTDPVIEDGMSLRSGKNLHLMREVVHDHELEEEAPLRDSRGLARGNTVMNTRTMKYDISSTSKKILKSRQNEKQTSMSEQKSQRRVNSRNEIGHNNYSDLSKQNTDVYRRRTIASYVNGYDSSSVSSNSVHVDNFHLNKNVRKTLEFDETDSGENEKAALELPEKLIKSKSHEKSSQQYITHLYGLDPVDSDTEFSDTGSGYTSTEYDDYSNIGRSRHRGHRDVSITTTTTTTTVITTITETFDRVSRPIRDTAWTYVGQPAMTYIGQPAWTYLGNPLWTYILYPVLSLISSVILTVWDVLFGEVGIVRGLANAVVSSVQKSCGASGVVSYISSVLLWILQKVESFIMHFVLLDVWLLNRRRNRGCCFCLPIILLIPFLIALASKTEMWSGTIFGNSSIFSFSYFDRPTPKIPDNVPFDKKAFFTQLNQEVKVWLLQHQQLQSTNQLSEADVEAIVYRVVNKELATLREEIALAAVASDKKQAGWRSYHEERMEHIIKQYNSLLVNVQNLETTVFKQKEEMAAKANSDFSQQSLYLAGLEEKLSAQKAKLDDIEREFGGLLLMMRECCHNKTYYATLVKDGVDAVLKERMAGYASGNVQDAFSEWLKLNFVNQENAESNLKSLESDLRAEVLATIKELETKQQRYYLELQQLQEEKQVNQQYTVNMGDGLGIDEQRVKMLIEAALLRYSADRIGIPDYALESAGGTIVSTRCSETYYKKTALLSVFGVPLWYSSNSPRTVIQPEVLPGQCWAFSGANGYVVIQTSALITPSGFTLEHIPKSLSPSGKIDTAPKDFTVIGLDTETDQDGMSLGNYTYTDDDRPLQYFPVQVDPDKLKTFYLFELRILNNHGSIQFTCLYRFRIHGKPFHSS